MSDDFLINALTRIDIEIKSILTNIENYNVERSDSRELNDSADGKFVGLHIAKQIVEGEIRKSKK